MKSSDASWWSDASVFGAEASAGGTSGDRDAPGSMVPTIPGRAHIMADGKLCFEDDDPFAAGIALTRGV